MGRPGRRDDEGGVWWTLGRIGTLGSVLSAVTATFIFWDTVCERAPGLARLIPFASCKQNPSSQIDASQLAERLEKKLDMIASRAGQPPVPVHEAFQATPLSFGRTLTTSVRKIPTDTSGTLRVFACSNGRSLMRYVGDTVYSRGPDEFVFTSDFPEPELVLLMQVAPASGSPSTIIAPWRLATQTRLKAPVSRAGVLNCTDVIGKF